MVQQIRTNEPQYICLVAVDSITGNAEEEIMTFGISADEAKNQAEQLLINSYNCDPAQVSQLMQQARVERVAQWCAPNPPQA